MSLITDTALLTEYKETRSIRNTPDKINIDDLLRLKILDYNLINENNDTLKLLFSSTHNPCIIIRVIQLFLAAVISASKLEIPLNSEIYNMIQFWRIICNATS